MLINCYLMKSFVFKLFGLFTWARDVAVEILFRAKSLSQIWNVVNLINGLMVELFKNIYLFYQINGEQVEL